MAEIHILTTLHWAHEHYRHWRLSPQLQIRNANQHSFVNILDNYGMKLFCLDTVDRSETKSLQLHLYDWANLSCKVFCQLLNVILLLNDAWWPLRVGNQDGKHFQHVDYHTLFYRGQRSFSRKGGSFAQLYIISPIIYKKIYILLLILSTMYFMVHLRVGVILIFTI